MATLRIQPGPGTYRVPSSVYVESDNDALAVCYTLDGTSPTAQNGTRYEGPFEIYDDATVIAAFVGVDGAATGQRAAGSGQRAAKYTIEKSPLDTPSIALSSGIYIGDQVVSITNNEPEPSLIYTLDGSKPSVDNGTVYTGPVTISANSPTTLKVVSTRRGFLASSPNMRTYRVLGSLEERTGPNVLAGDDVLEITDTHFLHRGPITLNGNATVLRATARSTGPSSTTAG